MREDNYDEAKWSKIEELKRKYWTIWLNNHTYYANKCYVFVDFLENIEEFIDNQ